MANNEAYLNCPAVITNPGEAYGAHTRAFQGIPSIACGGEGRLWAVWYGGKTPGEDYNNYVILARSTDNGHSWSDEQLVIDPDGEGPVRAFDPEIWLAPDGKLWLFWAQGLDEPKIGRSGVWAITADENKGADAQWSEPRRLCDGVMMCKPTVLSSGEWALPVSFWDRRERQSAGMVVSSDQGNLWTERGACNVPPEVRSFDEHMIVELKNGTLWMLVRTNYGIGESFSTDAGRTWDALKPTGIAHPETRFFIRRLASGRLLFMRHDSENDAVASGTSKAKRSHLKAFLSEDEGQNWPYSLLIDERDNVAYPDADQAEDGTIYTVYDYQRREAREILMAAFGEQDIIQENAETSRLRVLVNKATK